MVLVEIILIFAIIFDFAIVLCQLGDIQLNHYSVNKTICKMFDRLSKFFSLFFVHCFLFLIFYFINMQLLMVVMGCVYLLAEIVLIFKNFNKVKNIKFTKRMSRLIFVIMVIFVLLICAILMRLFISYMVYLFLPFLLVLDLLVVIMAVILLMPIEFLVGRFYINRAIGKLCKNNNLITIGITGSYGKTSTKNILNTLLCTENSVLCTPKSFNTPMGISSYINSVNVSTSNIFIAEMGAYKKGEIKYLCNMVKPAIGIVTSVGRQHMNTFKSLENVFLTKKELPDFLKCGTCVFNLNNLYVKKMFAEYSGCGWGVYVCSKHFKENKIFIKKIKRKLNSKIIFNKKLFECPRLNMLTARDICVCEDYIVFSIYYNSRFYMRLRVALMGSHNITNCLLACAVSIIVGVAKENIKLGFENVRPIKARMEKFLNSNGAVIINNGFNSNIDVVENSIRLLGEFKKSNKIIITPGLVDCDNAYKCNFEFGQKISKYCTKVIIVKKVNRNAIFEGLLSKGFLKENISFVDRFDDVKGFIAKLDHDNVVLIENDLPENYK